MSRASTRNRIRTATHPRERRAVRLTRGAVSIFELVARENFTTAPERGAQSRESGCTHATDPSPGEGTRVLALHSKFQFPAIYLSRSIHRAIHAEREIYGNDTVKSRPRARRSTREIAFCRRRAARAPSAIAFCLSFDSGISMQLPRRCVFSFFTINVYNDLLRVRMRSYFSLQELLYSTFLFTYGFLNCFTKSILNQISFSEWFMSYERRRI